jgi:hypothetical protein
LNAFLCLAGQIDFEYAKERVEHAKNFEVRTLTSHTVDFEEFGGSTFSG